MKADLDTLLQSSDYVSLHVPLLDSTRHMIKRREDIQDEKDRLHHKHVPGAAP